MARNPRFPIYIPSKSRAGLVACTMRTLDRMGVAYRIVVEEQQHDDYAARWGADRLLTLDPAYQRGYDTCDADDDIRIGLGSGPARNFIWDHAIAEGHVWYWCMDDNIAMFERFHHNNSHPVADGSILHAMEDFVLRYHNVAMAGPNYAMFVPSRHKRAPFRTGTRIYSCNLIRSDVPFRWRGRYNEDTILSLDILKAGWQTVLFDTFLQWKPVTQSLPGGNTEAFYAVKGTLPKSQMLARLHPDVTKVVWRWGRWHHQVDYSHWRGGPLVRRDGVDIPVENPYRFELVPRESQRSRTAR